MSARATRLWAAALCAVVVAGCSGQTPPPIPVLTPIVVDPVVSTPVAARGQVVAAAPFADVSADVAGLASAAIRATYLSTSAQTGASTRVTGSFFVPRGNPPAGGWPVISYAHGTTGIANGCGLSDTADLRGYATTVAGLLSLKYAVAATDYEGLGPTGQHPYLEPRTAAFNVIDAARALRTLAPTVSTRWAGVGESQGGQAVWAADELAGSYGTGLELVGALAVKPAANVTALARTAAGGVLTTEQRIIAPMIAVGAVRDSPGLTTADLLPGIPEAQVATLIGCDIGPRNALASSLSADRLKPVDAAAESRYAEQLRRDALPQRRVSAPLRVVYGTADRLIPPSWVTTAIRGACALGGPITDRAAGGLGHSDQLTDDSDLGWLRDRFAGTPAPTMCAGGETR